MRGNKFKEYDLIFSLGAACSCTQALRDSGLQFTSYPLDWLFGTNFVGRIEILTSNFNRFIEQNDLEYIYSERSISCDAYHNKFNDIVFNHDFPADVPLEQSYSAVREKYNRRIDRLMKNIDRAKSVLIVYIETPDCVTKTPNDDIVSAFSNVAKRWPGKHIDLLYLSCDLKNEAVTKLGPNITKIVTNYKNPDKNAPAYTVDGQVLSGIFGKYALNLSLEFRLRRMLAKFLLKFVPIKPYRKKLRKKYHVK